MIHPYFLRARAALWALTDALGAVSEAVQSEAITRVPLGPPSATPRTEARRGPRSSARLAALLHDERADRIANERNGIHQIGATSAPVRAELLDLARRAPVLVDEVSTDAAWIVASSLRRRPLLVYGHAWLVAGRLVDEHPAVAYLRVALAHAPRPVVEEVLAMLDREADVAWSTLRLVRPHMPMPGNPPCPCCDQRMLRVETSGPRASWAVTCGTGCVCAGDRCPCGMDIGVSGARHVWRLATMGRDLWS